MENKKKSAVGERLGDFAPAYVRFTDDMVYGDLWKRPGLAPRERSLLTLAALISAGNFQQIPFHLQLGLDNGLTQAELVEAITHLCVYAGWPRADTALDIAKNFFAKKGNPS